MTEVTLIIRYRTTGGRTCPRLLDRGELVEVATGDEPRRPAKTGDVNAAYAWLQANGFEPAGFQWLDPAGYQRRRVQTYRKGSRTVAAQPQPA